MQTQNDNLSPQNLIERAVSPTPSFWKRIQKIALIVGAVAGSVLTAGAALPATVATIATYATVISGSVAAVAQLTKKESEESNGTAETAN